MIALEDWLLVRRVAIGFLAGALFMLLVMPDPAGRRGRPGWVVPAFPDCTQQMVPHRCVDV
jgi:hypothetical protein